MIVDNASRSPGCAEPSSLQETCEVCRQLGGVAWIDLHKPTEEEFESVAKEFELHPLAVERTRSRPTRGQSLCAMAIHSSLCLSLPATWTSLRGWSLAKLTSLWARISLTQCVTGRSRLWTRCTDD